MLIACRDKAKGTNAVKDIRTTTGNNDVHLYIMDLASLESVRQCAKKVLKEETKLDILINNAGKYTNRHSTKLAPTSRVSTYHCPTKVRPPSSMILTLFGIL